MVSAWWLLLAFYGGGTLGFTLCAALHVSARADDRAGLEADGGVTSPWSAGTRTADDGARKVAT